MPRMAIMAANMIASFQRIQPARINKKIPIIALSANAYKKDVDNSLNAGMNSHLSKPIDTIYYIYNLHFINIFKIKDIYDRKRII